MENIANTAAKPSDLTTAQQDALSANVIATKFLNEVSNTLKPSGTQYGDSNSMADEQARQELVSLQNDPLKKQVLNQIATDMSDNGQMTQLGISGAVERDTTGNVTALTFSNSAMESLYNSNMVSAEQTGMTPTQAATSLSNWNELTDDTAQTGQVTFNVNDTSDHSRPQPPQAYYDGSNGVLTL